MTAGLASPHRRGSSFLRRCVLHACACAWLVLPLLPSEAGATRRDFYFQRVDAEPGLVQSSVNALLQDGQGFVWIATQGGLHRYDGYRLRLFQHDPADPHSLPDSFVTALARDGDTLWVGSQAGYVAALDLGSGAIRAFRRAAAAEAEDEHNTVAGLAVQPGLGVWAATPAGVSLLDPASGESRDVHRFAVREDSAVQVRPLLRQDGTLWVGAPDGLLRIDTATGQTSQVAPLPRVRALHADVHGQLWIGAGDGLYLRQPDGQLQRRWPAPDAPGVAVRSITADAQGRLWLALHDRGLLHFDPASGDELAIPYDPRIPDGLPERSIFTLMLDRSGLLWLGGDVHGVSTLHPEGSPFSLIVDLDDRRDPTRRNIVRSLHESPDGALWIGTDGDGLKRYDFEQDRFERWDTALSAALGSDPSGRIAVYGFADHADGQLWASTDRGLALLDPAAGTARTLAPPPALMPPDTPLRAITRGHDGALWIGTSGAGLLHLDPADGSWTRAPLAADATHPASLRINSVLQDRRGRLWAGSMGGLHLIDPDSGSARRFVHQPDDPASLSGNLVRSLLETRDGTIWIGTHSGLNRVRETDGTLRFERFGLADGLPDATLYGLLEDRQGRLWMSSNRGILRLDPATRAVRRYGIRDGLQGREFNGGAQLRLRDGRMAFGGLGGLNLFQPAQVRDSSYDPQIVLTGARVGRGAENLADLATPDALDFRQDARVLRFEFAALDFAAPELNRFRYQLDGFDRDWVDADDTASATYTNLAPGSYRFRVRATNRDGVWGPRVLDLPVTVRPLWWNSWPGRTAFALLGLGVVALVLLARRSKLAEQRALQREVRKRDERLKLALWGSGDEFWDWDIRENRLYRVGASELLGGSAEASISTDDWRAHGVHPDDLERIQQALQQHLVGATPHFASEHRVRRDSGEFIWVRSRGKIVERAPDGTPLRMAGTATNITAIREAERERRIASEVLRNMNEAVAVTDLEHRFVSVNPAFLRMTGYDESEIIGHDSALLDSALHEPRYYDRVRERLHAQGHWQGEMWQRRRDGQEFLCWIELTSVRDALDQHSHFVAVLNDITEKKRAEQELRYLANYDTLTGLPNRTLLAERLARAVTRARRQSTRVAVLFLDLDRFKDINDSLGHAAGDRILKSAAARLQSTVRDGDTVARLGGDEFTIVLEDLPDAAAAEAVAQAVLAAFEAPLELDGRSEIVISPSIGISLYPDHAHQPTDLLKFADTAMYEAKDRGRNTYQLYTEAMDADARTRALMVAALRRAIERDEFRLVFQPRMSLIGRHITGVEALLRWHSEDLGDVPPSAFIPLAEETGLILPIGEWVLRQACATLRDWRDRGLLDVSMAVNVSVLQFLRAPLPEQVMAILAEAGIPADRLELEVTESMVMANAEQTTAVLTRLRRQGVRLAIDDFGTGYSSLVYLKRLPIDTLKIDKEFVGDLTTDPDDEAITATIISMAHSLGLNVVAEGVETLEQLRYLREQGCDEIQGYWFAAPLERDACLRFIQQHRAPATDTLAHEPAGSEH